MKNIIKQFSSSMQIRTFSFSLSLFYAGLQKRKIMQTIGYANHASKWLC